MSRILAFFGCLLLVLIGSSALAQSSKKLWNSAFALSKEAKWAEVVTTLKPHLLPPPEDSMAPALLQLFALASWRTSDYPTTYVTLEKIENNYPGWTGLNETRYLKGEIEWSKRRFSKAWLNWSTIDSSYLSRIVANTSSGGTVLPLDTMEAWKNNPPYKESTTFTQWFLTQSVKSPILKKKNLPKIGIAIPFHLKENKKVAINNASIDFYRGMILANEVCSASDSGLEIHAFETNGSPVELQRYFTKNTFSGLDVLIGPIKFSLLQTMLKGAAEQKIRVINPLSNQTLKDYSPTYFSQQPGFNTIARECFSFISKYSLGSKYAIVFGPDRNDSLLAAAYRDHLKKMGRELTLFKKVGKNSAANLTKYLLEAGLDSTCHVFVANNEPLVRVQLLAAYGWMKSKYPMLVYGKWIEGPNPDFDEFTRNPIYFADPDLPDHSVRQWKEWESSFISKWGTPPNWIAWKGFDLVRFLSKQWYGDGNGFLSGVNSPASIQSELFGEYRFSTLYSDNQYVPIFKVEKEGLKKVWPE